MTTENITVDINCDMGEIAEAVADGSQEALMSHLTSVNIACGGHAGDERMMQETIAQAQRWNLHIGAHPGYPDRPNFGRVPLEMPLEQITRFVFQQVRTLGNIASQRGAALRHVKPHGALYNSAVSDAGISQAIARGVALWSKNLILVGLAGSKMLNVFREEGFQVAAEAFADRRYEPDGSLRSRRYADSLITEPGLAANQARDIVTLKFVTAVDGSRIPLSAETICIHGDTPGALAIVTEVAKQLGVNNTTTL